MSRRSNSKREFPIPDPVYNSYLVSLLDSTNFKKWEENASTKNYSRNF